MTPPKRYFVLAGTMTAASNHAHDLAISRELDKAPRPLIPMTAKNILRGVQEPHVFECSTIYENYPENYHSLQVVQGYIRHLGGTIERLGC